MLLQGQGEYTRMSKVLLNFFLLVPLLNSLFVETPSHHPTIHSPSALFLYTPRHKQRQLCLAVRENRKDTVRKKKQERKKPKEQTIPIQPSPSSYPGRLWESILNPSARQDLAFPPSCKPAFRQHPLGRRYVYEEGKENSCNR